MMLLSDISTSGRHPDASVRDAACEKAQEEV